ncbi:MAG: hypothetical protein WBV85_01900 [Solirubrobacteraceae bacterium]
MSKDHKRSAWLRGVFATTVACLALLCTLTPFATAASRAPKPHEAPAARESKTVSLRESGNLHLTTRHGFTLNEQGAGTGTISGTIYVHLKIVSTKEVTAEMNIYLKGGSITGEAGAAYHREGAIGHFAGSLSIVRGTGSYANAHGSGLSFSGTIQRSNYAVTVHVSGTVSD